MWEKGKVGAAGKTSVFQRQRGEAALTSRRKDPVGANVRKTAVIWFVKNLATKAMTDRRPHL